jgi:hypothetical protein
MATARVDRTAIHIETDVLSAEVRTEGYVSGVAGGTLLDKKTGARDLGHGLDIVDFLLEPRWDEEGPNAPPQELRYRRDPAVHGDIPKRYVELPQICTRARRLEYELVEGDDFVAVRQWFTYTEATYGRTPGSRWEQVIVFRDGQRYFFSADKITSNNTVDDLILRIDMPGHLKHKNADSFEAIYLSYHGLIRSREFLADFPPDARFLYRRADPPLPDRFIRAYQVRLEGRPGPWLAGMTLRPEVVWEAWCHQRGYVCFIQEIGGYRVEAGSAFGAAYVVGWFDDIADMLATYDTHRGPLAIQLTPTSWRFADRL